MHFYAWYPLLARRLHSLLAAGFYPPQMASAFTPVTGDPRGLQSHKVCSLCSSASCIGMAWHPADYFVAAAAASGQIVLRVFARRFLPAGVPWPARVLLRAFDRGGIAKLSYSQLRVTLTLHVFRDAW